MLSVDTVFKCPPHLVLVLLLCVECSPVTLAVAEVLLLLAPGVGGQQSAQQAETEEWLWGGLGDRGGDGVNSQGQAAQQRYKLKHKT